MLFRTLVVLFALILLSPCHAAHAEEERSATPIWLKPTNVPLMMAARSRRFSRRSIDIGRTSRSGPRTISGGGVFGASEIPTAALPVMFVVAGFSIVWIRKKLIPA